LLDGRYRAPVASGDAGSSTMRDRVQVPIDKIECPSRARKERAWKGFVCHQSQMVHSRPERAPGATA